MKFVYAFVAVLALSTTAQGAEKSCRADIGEVRAAELVRQCIDISPATHPPCHADNPCEMIRAEIKRGCDATHETPDAGAPNYCDEEETESY